MTYDSPLLDGVLIRRYKRFLSDIRVEGGEEVTAHCANSGSMKGCSEPGSAVRLAFVLSKTRKLKYDWHQIRVGDEWVGVRPVMANALAEEGIRSGVISELQGYDSLRSEVPYGSQRSRIDFLLEDEDGGRPPCYVEVKSVSLAEGERGYFPDSVSTRGRKHLEELMEVKAKGERAVLLFVAQRGDVVDVRPADSIDPEYGQTLREAAKAGVEILAYGCSVRREGITIERPLPVVYPAPLIV